MSADARHGARAYAWTWLALVALLVASFALARARLGAWGTPIALGIGLVKAALIALVFMHLRGARASYVVAAVTALALIATLVGLMVVDVAMRAPPRLLTP